MNSILSMEHRKAYKDILSDVLTATGNVLLVDTQAPVVDFHYNNRTTIAYYRTHKKILPGYRLQRPAKVLRMLLESTRKRVLPNGTDKYDNDTILFLAQELVYEHLGINLSNDTAFITLTFNVAFKSTWVIKIQPRFGVMAEIVIQF